MSTWLSEKSKVQGSRGETANSSAVMGAHPLLPHLNAGSRAT